MKNLEPVVLSSFVLLTIFSCEKDDDALAGVIKFKMNGVEQSFSGYAERSELSTIGELKGDYVLDIVHNNKKSIWLDMYIWDFEETEKEYFINNQSRSFNPYLEIDDMEITGEEAHVGSIEITEISGNRIKGKFNFKAKSGVSNIVSITEGTFDLPYDSSSE